MKSKVSDSSLFILHFPPSQGGLGRVSLSHTTHHPDARADGRKDGDERLNHQFPNFTFFHIWYFLFCYLLFTIYFTIG